MNQSYSSKITISGHRPPGAGHRNISSLTSYDNELPEEEQVHYSNLLTATGTAVPRSNHHDHNQLIPTTSSATGSEPTTPPCCRQCNHNLGGPITGQSLGQVPPREGSKAAITVESCYQRSSTWLDQHCLTAISQWMSKCTALRTIWRKSHLKNAGELRSSNLIKATVSNCSFRLSLPRQKQPPELYSFFFCFFFSICFRTD